MAYIRTHSVYIYMCVYDKFCILEREAMRVPLYLPTEHELSPTHVCWLRHYINPGAEVDRLSPDDKVFAIADGPESGIYYDR
jgi:hypothetical protein